MDLITQKSHTPSLPSFTLQSSSRELPSDGGASPEDQEPLRIFVFDTQRTSAQLFSRHLLSHLRFGSISNPYALAATLGPDRVQPKLQNNELAKKAWDDQIAAAPTRITSLTYNIATERLLREADKLEHEGKILFVREQSPLIMRPDVVLSAIHSHEPGFSRLTNPTCLPDAFLALVTPIIFIRHPAKVIPAWLREANSVGPFYNIDDDDLTFWTSARWSRMIFDYLRPVAPAKRPASRRRRADSVLSTHQDLPLIASWPIVIDDADVVNNTHAILLMLCRLLDLDTADMEETWGFGQKFQRACESVAKTITENLLKAFTDRVRPEPNRSSQKHRRTTSQASEELIDLDAEQAEWKREFGDETAQALRRKVEDELPHYHYLRNFKLRALPSAADNVTFKEDVFGSSSAPIPLAKMRSASMWGHEDEIWSSGVQMKPIFRSASLRHIAFGSGGGA